MKRSQLSAALTILGVMVQFSLIAYAQNPVAFVSRPLVPSATAPGGPSLFLTINGTGFVEGATVNWNGAPLSTTLVSSSGLTALVPATNIASPITACVTVVSPGPGGGTSNGGFFQITNADWNGRVRRLIKEITVYSYPVLLRHSCGRTRRPGCLPYRVESTKLHGRKDEQTRLS
jgi:hypothetical protein